MSVAGPAIASPVPAAGLAGYRRLFRQRRFTWFFLSQATGDAGYAIYTIAIPYLAFRISGSFAVAGLVLGVEFGVYALSFLAGPVIDKVADLRTILLVGYPIQGAVALLLGYLAATGALTVPVLLVLVVALSFPWNFTWTATNAIPPKIVGADELFPASALMSATSDATQVAGYAAGAALILLLSPAAGPILYGIANFVAAALAVPVLVPQASAARAWWTDLVEGWRAFRDGGGRPLIALSTFSAAEAFFSAGPPLLILAAANLRGPNAALTYGVLFTSFAVGGVVGSLVLGVANPRSRLGLALIGSTVSEGVLIVLAVLLAPLGLVAAPVWFAAGAVDVVFYQSVIVFLQATSPPDLVGRTLTNHYLFRGTGRAAGATGIGFVLAAAPFLLVGLASGLAFLVVAGLAVALVPTVRRLAF
ncbi:MAG TPA: MFS transporter [Thermoplasmata archaeon]|nr:MFS transporter [Thermoplasmata archaeon]